MDRQTQRLLFLVLLFCAFFFLYQSSTNFHFASRSSLEFGGPQLFLRGLKPANATLGVRLHVFGLFAGGNVDADSIATKFGAAIAVSRAQSTRREGLLAAANATEVDLVIPNQPAWTEDDVLKLRASKDSHISQGSALAWLGHLNALRWFLSTNLKTVLILEDDVDWDVRLRTMQIPAVAATIRKLVTGYGNRPGQIKYEPLLDNYWGNSSDWDVIYLGHCGDNAEAPALASQTAQIAYQDPTLPLRTDMHPYTQRFLDGIGLPHGLRLVHRSIFPLCSFGYAVTREAAHRLLNEFAAREADGGTMAYDVRLLEACRDPSFRCWTVNPELFHHIKAVSEIAMVDSDGGDLRREPPAVDDGRAHPLVDGRAPNIACSARNHDEMIEGCPLHGSV